MREPRGPRTLNAVARPDGAPIYVIQDNLSANKTPAIRAWAARNKVELCFTPTSASWANPIEAQFGPLRMFTMANSNDPNHTVLAREMQKISTLAQRQRPPPGRTRRATPRTRPSPQRTTTTLGSPSNKSSLTDQTRRTFMASARERLRLGPPRRVNALVGHCRLGSSSRVGVVEVSDHGGAAL